MRREEDAGDDLSPLSLTLLRYVVANPRVRWSFRARSFRAQRRHALASVAGGAELALEGLEMRTYLGIARTKRLDLAHRAHDRGVIAVAEGATELGEAALQALLAEVHRDVTR